ncbi:MAG: YgjV family protein [Firmicutes bacterium]|nr:YgjV family protein [Bacillota bacterium]
MTAAAYTLNFWLAQGISAAATVVTVISFQIKNKNILLVMNAIANGLICASLTLLEAYLGAVLTVVAIIRGFMFFKLEKRPKWYACLALSFICALVVWGAAFTYENYFSIIMLAATLALVFVFWQKNIYYIRFVSIGASIIFIIYNVINQAYTIIVLESIIIVSCVVFLVRALLAKRRQQKLAAPPPESSECKEIESNECSES